MPAVSFETLPTDLLLAIFSVSTPASVRTCWHVCPSFKELISTNDYLQYVLALLACGYVEPLCPRTDLSYAQKKRILKDHLHRWYKNDVVATYHELPTGKGRLVASAKGTTMWAPEGTTGYMFFQNPSNNRGTRLNQWNFFPQIKEASAAVDPDQNLLAILDLSYTIHLLTATTQERHPKSPTMPIVYDCDTPNRFGTLWGDRIELFGSLVIGVFAMNRGITLSALVIWNWMTGQEIMRVVIKTSDHVRRYMNRIFDFLSEDTIVICRQFDPTETLTQSLPENTFGLLDIYKFDPLAISPATLVASLALPANILTGETEMPAVYFSSSLYTPPSLRPQVWKTTPETRLLCISVDGMFRWESVCVQAQTLLEYAGTTSGSIVRWTEWRLQAAWDKWNRPISNGSYRIRTDGHRLISAGDLPTDEGIQVRLFELESTQKGRIVPVMRAEFVIEPDLSTQNVDEKPLIGPLTEIGMNNESIMVFRETVTSDGQTRDLMLRTF